MDRKIYCASPSELNDIEEGEARVDFDASEDFKRFKARRRIRKERPGTTDTTTQLEVRTRLEHVEGRGFERFRTWLKSGVGVFSTSVRPDIPSQWERYADYHRGICIVLGCPLDGPMEHELDFFAHFWPVRYIDKLPRVNFYRDSPQTKAEAFLLTKRECWRDEEEWRLIDMNGSGLRSIPAFAVSGIILGSEISIANRTLVLDWIRPDRSIQLYQSSQVATSIRITEIPRLGIGG